MNWSAGELKAVRVKIDEGTRSAKISAEQAPTAPLRTMMKLIVTIFEICDALFRHVEEKS
jgi:hypothetical protein